MKQSASKNLPPMEEECAFRIVPVENVTNSSSIEVVNDNVNKESVGKKSNLSERKNSLQGKESTGKNIEEAVEL